MVVAAARLSLVMHGCFSLKDKRRLLLRLKDRLRNQFANVAVAEVGGQDSWTSAVVGLAVVSNDASHAREMLNKAVEFVDSLALGELLDDQSELFRL